MAIQPGELIEAKYRIVRVLGQGGMGTVYEGENIHIKRRVAIKVLHGEVAKNKAISRRFEREAQAAARIGSKYITDVLDLGSVPTGERFMVMEFLEGEDLADRIKRMGALAPEAASAIAVQVLSGLIAAHEVSIIHRDMKPANVFITQLKDEEGELAKIMDFGVSKFISNDDLTDCTRVGTVLGTPHYMAPEQAKGETVDARTDIYSFGVVLYQMLSGQVPFKAKSFNELLFKMAREEYQPIEALVPHISRGIAAIVNCAMAQQPQDRYQSALEFKEALLHWAIDEGHNTVAAIATSGRYAAIGSAPGAPPAVAVVGASGPYPAAATAHPAQPSGSPVQQASSSGPYPSVAYAQGAQPNVSVVAEPAPQATGGYAQPAQTGGAVPVDLGSQGATGRAQPAQPMAPEAVDASSQAQQWSAAAVPPMAAQPVATGSYSTADPQSVIEEPPPTTAFPTIGAAGPATSQGYAPVEANSSGNLGDGSMMVSSGDPSQVVLTVSSAESGRRTTLALILVGAAACGLLGVIVFLLARSPEPVVEDESRAAATGAQVTTVSASIPDAPVGVPSASAVTSAAPESSTPVATGRGLSKQPRPKVEPPLPTVVPSAVPAPPVDPPPQSTSKGDNIDPWAE